MSDDTHVIGPNFGEEVIAAGLGGLPFTWGEDGEIAGREELTDDQNAALDDVIAAHDPTKAGPYVLSKFVMLGRMSDAEADKFSAMSAKDRLLWDATPELVSNTDFFSAIRTFLASITTETRARELLAKE